MSENTKAGVIATVKFCPPGDQTFANYIEYIDRDEAIKPDNITNFSLFADYMDNSAKTIGLFNSTGYLTSDEKKSLKTKISDAQGDGSCLIQGIFSFDTDWIIENGLVDTKTGLIREDTLRHFACDAIEKMLEKEHFENAVWTASIHHNTEHVHVHFALVDPDVVWEAGKGRCVMNKKGELQQKGTISKKAIEAAKSRLANSIMKTKDLNVAVTNIIREQIVAPVKNMRTEHTFNNREVSEAILKLVHKLPDNLGKWGYNNSEMKPFRNDIDRISDIILNTELSEEFMELKNSLSELQEKYEVAYSGKYAADYYNNKMDDLYRRLGNAILFECKNIYRDEHALKKSNYKNYEQPLAYSLNHSLSLLKKSFRKSLSSMKNQAIYEYKFSELHR